MNKEFLTDNHKLFINKNLWINDIDFNNVDIIECKEVYLYCFIASLIQNKVIQCNILIDEYKFRYYYNGKHYINKIRFVSLNNKIRDILRDSEGNKLFSCEDKNEGWGDKKDYFYPYNDFTIKNVNKEGLVITYIK